MNEEIWKEMLEMKRKDKQWEAFGVSRKSP